MADHISLYQIVLKITVCRRTHQGDTSALKMTTSQPQWFAQRLDLCEASKKRASVQ